MTARERGILIDRMIRHAIQYWDVPNNLASILRFGHVGWNNLLDKELLEVAAYTLGEPIDNKD